MTLRFNFFMAIVSILAFPFLCVSCISRYRFSLRETDYIEHSDRLSLLNEGVEKPFILSKNYLFTKTDGLYFLQLNKNRL